MAAKAAIAAMSDFVVIESAVFMLTEKECRVAEWMP
jgi:hypothetical protein